MRIDDFKQRLTAVKRFLDPPIGADAVPLEIRAAAIEAIEQKVAVIRIKRRTFPYDAVAVRLLARTADQKAMLQPVFADLDERVRERFREVRCDVPANLDVRVVFLKKAPADWLGDQLFAVECTVSNHDVADRGPTPAAIPSMKVTILKGTASRKVYSFEQSLILIGRTPEATDTKGALRRNHVSFDDGAATVSRAHARLKYDKARREFRILDEGSARGTRIVRGDAMIQVPRDPRGVRIQSGDEVCLGEAAVKVVIE